MTSHKRVAKPDDPDKALVKGIAMDIGKEVVSYVERMYPQAVSAASSTFRLSLRNAIYNEIIAALKETDPDKIVARLEQRRIARRRLKATDKLINETDWEHYRENKMQAEPKP